MKTFIYDYTTPQTHILRLYSVFCAFSIDATPISSTWSRNFFIRLKLSNSFQSTFLYVDNISDQRQPVVKIKSILHLNPLMLDLTQRNTYSLSNRSSPFNFPAVWVARGRVSMIYTFLTANAVEAQTVFASVLVTGVLSVCLSYTTELSCSSE